MHDLSKNCSAVVSVGGCLGEGRGNGERRRKQGRQKNRRERERGEERRELLFGPSPLSLSQSGRKKEGGEREGEREQQTTQFQVTVVVRRGRLSCLEFSLNARTNTTHISTSTKVGHIFRPCSLFD